MRHQLQCFAGLGKQPHGSTTTTNDCTNEEASACLGRGGTRHHNERYDCNQLVDLPPMGEAQHPQVAPERKSRGAGGAFTFPMADSSKW